MEEILASIRRIIADDQTAPAPRRERDLRPRLEPRAKLDEPAAAAQKAYSAPALEPALATEDPDVSAEDVAPQPAPVVEIRQLRLHRAAPPSVAAQPTRAEEPQEDASAETPENRVDDDELQTPFAPLSAEAPALRDRVAEGLVSTDTATSVASHFQALTAGMLLNDSGLLQQYAREMMRPMLKQWLDDNLPVIVERLVRAEIERVARGGRR